MVHPRVWILVAQHDDADEDKEQDEKHVLFVYEHVT